MARNLLVINVALRETRVALIENGVIAELQIERARARSTVGNIVLGKVTRVLPGMQAAFIDVGMDRAAFLHVEDLIRPNDFEDYLAGAAQSLERKSDLDASGDSDEADAPAGGESNVALPAHLASEPGDDEPLVGGDAADDDDDEDYDEDDEEADFVHHAHSRAGLESEEEPHRVAHLHDDELDSEAEVERFRGDLSDGFEADDRADGDGDGDVAAAPDADEDDADEDDAEEDDVDEDDADEDDADEEDDVDEDDADEDDADEDDADEDDADEDDAEEDDVDEDDADEDDADEDDADDDDADDDDAVGADVAVAGAAENQADAAAELSPPVRVRRRAALAPPAAGEGAVDEEAIDAEWVDAEAGTEPAAEPGSGEEADGRRRRRRRGRRRRSGSAPEERSVASAPEERRAEPPARAEKRDAKPGRRDRSRGDKRRDRQGRGRDRRPEGRDGRATEGRKPDAARGNATPARVSRSVPITEVVREGDQVVVQISKEPIGTKGARVTSHVSLPGRHVVYLPTVDHIGISKRIGSFRERLRLRKAIDSVKPPTGGLIVRTVAEGLTKKHLKEDIGYLLKLWAQVAKKRETARAPDVLYEELDLVLKVARDLFTDEIEKIVIDDKEEYTRIVRFVEMFMPNRVKDVELYSGDDPIFDAYGIEDEIARALSRKVPLPSGGYLILDQAEALTAIDVNTGRYVGKGSKDLEETALKTNLEAVDEIAYQLRFRNIGGLVILDLIDMENAKSRDKVWRALEQRLEKDKAKTTLNRISELGLIEMTRKRTRESLGRTMHEPCFYCDGTGQIMSRTTIAYEILRQVRRELHLLPGYSVHVNAHPAIVDLLKTEEKDAVVEAERRYMRRIEFTPRREYHIEQFDLTGK